MLKVTQSQDTVPGRIASGVREKSLSSSLESVGVVEGGLYFSEYWGGI